MREAFHLSPQQRRLWRRGAGAASARAAWRLRLTGALDAARLRGALEALVARHEILRTVFVRPAGSPLPFQEIHPPGPAALAWSEGRRGAADAAAAVDRMPALAADLSPAGGAGEGAPASWELALSLPVLCADRLSLEVLSRELAELYGGGTSAGEPFQYADYAEWRHEEEAAAGDAVAGEAAEAPPRLPWEPPRREGGDVAAPLRTSRAIDGPLAAALRRAADGWGCREAAVVLTAWGALLARFAGRAELSVAVPAAGRGHDELAAAVGPFAEWRRLATGGGTRRAGRDAALDVDAALGRLADAAPAGTEVEITGFEWIEPPPAVTAGGVRFALVADDLAWAAPPLTLEVRAGGEARCLDLIHDPHRLDAAEAERLLDRLLVLLGGVVEHGERRLDRQPLLRRDAARPARFAAPPPPSALRPVHEQFAEAAALRPDDTALVFEATALSYRDLARRSAALAQRLRRMGVGPEVPVPLLMERSAESVVAMLGVLAAGGAFVALDLAQPAERLRRLVAELAAPVALASGETATVARGLSLPVLDLAEVAADDVASGGPAPLAAGNLAYLIFTSGSTGTPKAVAVEHRNLSHYVWSATQRMDLAACRSFACVSTLAADLGYTAVFAALCSGATLHLVSHQRAADPARLAAHFRRHPVDCLKVVPGHLAALTAGDGAGDLLPRLRLVLGGEALAPAQLAALRRRAPAECRIFNHYGPTETTVGAAAAVVEEVDPRTATVPIGDALPGLRLDLLDGDLEPVADWLPGEIHVAGPTVSRGYLGRPAATAERFLPDPLGEPGGRRYRTGDLGRRLPCGAVEFLGRRDGQLKLRGFRVELGEVESALAGHPGLREVAVVAAAGGVPRLLAYVAPAANPAPEADELEAFLAARLPAYMLPASYTRLAALPRTANGKVDRAALPPPADEPATDRPYSAPQGRTEEILCRIWQRVLGVERVGTGDNFFALGGDSILSIQVIARAAREGLRLEPMDIFEHQTVAEVAQVARTQTPAAAGPDRPLTGPLPLTPIQHRFFELDLPTPQHWNQALLLELVEPVPPAALAAALREVFRHHDALRLRFERDDGGWQQSYAGPAAGRPGLAVDLAALPPERRDGALSAVAGRLQAGFDLASGALLRAVLFELGGGCQRLFLVAHHLVVDGVSWRILVDDLQSTIGAVRRGEPLALPPKSASYRDYSAALQRTAALPATTEEAAYWLGEDRLQIEPPPVDGADGPAREGDARTVRRRLDAATTRALLNEAPAAYRASIEELMLTAFAAALASCWSRRRLLVDVERHGRDVDGLDLSRTVGWFTVVVPMLLEPGDGGAGERVRRIKEQLRAVPGSGSGHALLRYLAADPELRRRLAAAPRARVRFNYLGQSGAAVREGSLFRLADADLGPARAADAPLAHDLGVDLLVDAGRLRSAWIYAPGRLREATVSALADAFHATLAELVEARGEAAGSEAPSDFPLAALSREELERVSGLLREIDQG